MRFAASYLDGQSARGQSAEVEVEGRFLSLYLPDGGRLGWPLGDIRYADPPEARPRNLRLRRIGTDERLTLLSAEAEEAVRAACPDLRGRGDSRHGVWRPVLLWGGGAAVSLALLFWFFLPALAGALADAIPQSLTHRLGGRLVPQIAQAFGTESGGKGAVCADSSDNPALAALTDRLRPPLTDPPLLLEVWVIRSPIVNAVALPGGHVIVFSGLLDFVESGDELAGVLAHEIGHVVSRHPIEITVERAAVSAFFGLFFGDITGGTMLGGLASSLVGNAYSRDMERQADEIGVELMLNGGLDPHALARFFARLDKKQGRQEKAMAFFSTHPTSAERRDAIQAVPLHPRPIPEGDWKIIKNICKK